jgi:cysteine-rich repeat protein
VSKEYLRRAFLKRLTRFTAPFAALLLLSAGTVFTAGCGGGGSSGSGQSGSASSGGGQGGDGQGGSGQSGSGQSGSGQSGSGQSGSGGTTCTVATTCPGMDNECQTRTCKSGQCGVDFTAKDTALTAQTAGDCKTAVCDGKGGITAIDDNADILDDANACTTDSCNGGMPSNTPTASGTSCSDGGSGTLCDGNGACVECLQASDCSSSICEANKCIAASCQDQVKNGEETDVDCGGKDCLTCDDLQTCVDGSDCKSSVCVGNICLVPTCTDGAKNGAETDQDCGGATCGPCDAGEACQTGTDCISGQCSGSVCVATCSDNAQNQGETDIDCGGPNCSACDDGKGCAAGSDCQSQVCSSNVCQAPTCADGAKNGAETDQDCGGPNCGPCNDGKGCAAGSDCQSQVCSGDVCQAPTCIDLVKNGVESDVDCGGPTCLACDPGKACVAFSDCQSQICNAGVCTTPVCGDGVVVLPDACDDANTTSNDGCSSTCSIESGYTCSGTPSVCVTTCGDGIVAGAEQCDDANTAGGDGCTGACSVEIGHTCTGSPSVCVTICGDGIVAGAEQCDDSNTTSNDGCAASCTVESGYTCSGSPSVCATTCGDGIQAGAEGCDDANTTDNDGCTAACAVQPGYTCTGSPSVCVTTCGDGIVAGAEQCDDANTTTGDCCGAACQAEAGCEIELNNTPATANDFAALSINNKINGFIQPAGEKDYFSVTVPTGGLGVLNALTVDNFLGTTCVSNTMDSVLTVFDSAAVQLAVNDDSNGNRCSNVTAVGLAPGQYFIEMKAFSANATFAYTMQATLTVTVCGNGVIEQGEQCEDGNTTSGDGCSATCQFEPIPESEPNSTCAEADGPFPLTSTVNSFVLVGGDINPANESDFYGFTIPVFADVRFETFDSTGPGSCKPSTVDTVIQVFASDCVTAVTPPKDQGGIGNCSKLDPSIDTQVRHLAPGTYFVKVFPFNANTTFKYDLQVTLVSSCGNGVKEGSEACDGGAGCDASCEIIPTCGDGTVSATEICDDGNTTNGDGCSSTCQFEGFANEIEPNNTLPQANANGIVINADKLFVGSISTATDKDIYKVDVAAQSTIRFETFEQQGPADCPTISTTLRLLDSAGTQLKTQIAGIKTCSSLVVNLAPATYYIQVERTGSTGTITKYFLETKFVPDVGTEIEPNETQATASALAGTEMFVFGGHQTGTDLDFYAITVPAGASLRAETIEADTAETCESNGIDSFLTLFDAAAVSKVTNDDTGRGFCSEIDGTGAIGRDAGAHNLAAGTYFLQVKASPLASATGAVFDYRLVITIR